MHVFLEYKMLQTITKHLIFLAVSFTFLIAQNTAFAAEQLPSLTIEKLEQNIYLHTSFEVFDGFGIVASNGLVVIDDKDAYIIDTPASTEDTRKLVAWFEVQGLAIKGSISTHFHDDSSAGIDWLNSNSIPTYASKLTNKLLNSKNKAQASNAFDGDSVWLANDQIEVFYPGAGHSVDNMVVWMPKQKVLFGGCFVKSKSLGNLSDAVIEAWPESAQRVISRYSKAALVVPGHGKVGNASLLESTKKLAIEAQRQLM